MEREVTSTTETANAEATRAFGAELARSLAPGAVVALDGPLGAGKTHLAQGLVEGLGYAGAVTSPTFTLVHEYLGGRLPAYHFDFYRLDSAEEVLALGWDEYLDSGGVLIVEWAERFPALLPADTLWLRLEIPDDAAPDARRIFCLAKPGV